MCWARHHVLQSAIAAEQILCGDPGEENELGGSAGDLIAYYRLHRRYGQAKDQVRTDVDKWYNSQKW
jgi:hypothetical protein